MYNKIMIPARNRTFDELSASDEIVVPIAGFTLSFSFFEYFREKIAARLWFRSMSRHKLRKWGTHLLIDWIKPQFIFQQVFFFRIEMSLLRFCLYFLFLRWFRIESGLLRFFYSTNSNTHRSHYFFFTKSDSFVNDIIRPIPSLLSLRIRFLHFLWLWFMVRINLWINLMRSISA